MYSHTHDIDICIFFWPQFISKAKRGPHWFPFTPKSPSDLCAPLRICNSLLGVVWTPVGEHWSIVLFNLRTWCRTDDGRLFFSTHYSGHWNWSLFVSQCGMRCIGDYRMQSYDMSGSDFAEMSRNVSQWHFEPGPGKASKPFPAEWGKISKPFRAKAYSRLLKAVLRNSPDGGVFQWWLSAPTSADGDGRQVPSARRTQWWDYFQLPGDEKRPTQFVRCWGLWRLFLSFICVDE